MTTMSHSPAELDFYRALFEKAAVGLCLTGSGGRLLAVNHALATMLGYPSPEAMLGSRQVAERSLDPGDREELRRRVAEHGGVSDFDIPMRRQDGRIIWVSITVNVVGANGVVTVVDVTARRQHEEASRANEARLRSVLANSSENYFILDKNGDVTKLSSDPESNLGYEPTVLASREAHLVHPDDRRPFDRVINKLFSGRSDFEVTRYRGRHKDGSWRYLEARVTNMLRDPDVEGLVINVRDITDEVSAQEKLEYTELHDDLTDLPNQRFLDRWIDEHTDGEAGSNIAILLVDVDHLSDTNNSFDRAAGDEILTFVADSLRQQVPDGAVLVRWAGDSFAIVVCGELERDKVAGLAEDIVRACRHTHRIDAVDVFVSVSVGVAVSGRGQGQVQDLLRDADTALHQAKARGRNRFQLFTGSMQLRLAARLKLEGELRHAVEDPGGMTQLQLLFDPLVSLRDRNTVGMEALVAWKHREHGLLRASEFVPLAEETGLISPIGHWVLGQACQKARQLNRGRQGDLLAMSVNLSGHELNHPEIVAWVTREIARAEIDPTRLWLEITETALVSSPSIRSTLWRLRDLGVRLVVDDFGTGYSSLTSVRELPVDVVKIDRSFVAGLGRRTKDETIVRTIVDLARSLDMLTVGEGVETADQAAILAELGCELGQGYLFGAIPAEPARTARGGQPTPVGG
ncbi:MAG TPA: EAL domain-containing protein [Acidimicrobiales bacterium]|nr:EAL domain-containing protein [Acidimicrobiales bacterium]